MKITVEFNSLQELDEFCNGVAIAPALTQKAREENAQQPQEEPKKAEAKEEAKTEASEVPFEEEKGGIVPQKAAPAKEEAPDVSKLQVEVRKMLAQVNKKIGTNTASQWIKELTSVEKLTEVQNADELLALKAKAEEVLNG